MLVEVPASCDQRNTVRRVCEVNRFAAFLQACCGLEGTRKYLALEALTKSTKALKQLYSTVLDRWKHKMHEYRRRRTKQASTSWTEKPGK